jgi:hypothetical protein
LKIFSITHVTEQGEIDREIGRDNRKMDTSSYFNEICKLCKNFLNKGINFEVLRAATKKRNQTNSVAQVCERTIPTE